MQSIRVTLRERLDRIGRALACLLILGCALGTSACERGPKPPDVILVTLDTTRADHLGAYGYTQPTSPNIDAFARDAVLFRRAWSTSPWTLPSHASMFTGKYPTSHGAHHNSASGDAKLGETLRGERFREVRVNRLAEGEVTLAELLSERGYATGAFVGGPWLAPPFGLLQGYEVRDADVYSYAGRSADELTTAALAWMQGVPSWKPLHMLVNYFDPHDPYDPPADFRPTGKPDVRRYYDGEIRFMDHHLGRLLEALRATSRYDTALIIVVSDHGELFGEHGATGHGHWHYEELIRIPLIIRFPGGRDAGTINESVVSVVDLLPVVAMETGAPLPSGIDGLPLGQRGLALAESYRDVHGVKTFGPSVDRDLATLIRWPWKLITSDKGERQLYRLDVDPTETSNRAGAEIQPELLAQLTAEREKLVPAHPVAPRDVDPRTLESLRALGYVE